MTFSTRPSVRLFLSFFFLLAFCLALPMASEAKRSWGPLIGPAASSRSIARILTPFKATGFGDKVPVMVEIRMEKGWKTYWRTPGDAGIAPVFNWEGSENVKSAEVHYPGPRRFSEAGFDSYGYESAVAFPVDITIAEQGKSLSLKLKIDYASCKDVCIPESKELQLVIPAGAPDASDVLPYYQSVVTHLPQSGKITFEKAFIDYDRENKNYLVVEGSMADTPKRDADLFVESESLGSDGGISIGKPETKYDGRSHHITMRAPINSDKSYDDIRSALGRGDLTLTYVDRKMTAEGTVSLGARPGGSAAEPTVTLKEKLNEFDLRILSIALLGGLILNLMPCVLPVLSLKVLSVVSHGGKDKDNRWKIFRNFMASALGILCSFWLMAGVLAALKSAGGSVGWGIQFQHPVFLSFLIILLVLFAASLFDLFDIPLPRFIARNIPAKHEHEPTLLGHFLLGAFATFLATPCSAPFLGTAVGFALASGTFEIFVTFTFLGLGLALPHIILAFSPGLFRFMPKPGRWMRHLKRFLALLLLVTAGWLGSVLVTVTSTPALEDGWQQFDTALIGPAVAGGKTVVVDITADWCLTCKVNKKMVLEQDDVAEALSAPNVVRLQADWTHRDEAIATYLRSFGRYGIPFNAVYGPGAPDGIALPELLSKEDVLGAISEAAGE